MPSKKKSSTKKQSRINTINRAVASLKHLEASLEIDPAMLPEERKRLQGYGTIPAKAITIAADIVKQNPERFGDFSATEMNGAVEFETQMAPLAVQARSFADHLDKAIQKQRAPAAESALALYAIVKGLGRVKANESFRDHANNLHALLKRARKSPRAKRATATATAAAATQQPAASSTANEPVTVASASPTTTTGPSAAKPS